MWRNILGFIIGFVIGGAIVFVYYYEPELPDERHRLIGLKKQVDKINQRTPILVDGFLLLDNIWVYDGAVDSEIAHNIIVHQPETSEAVGYSVEPKIQYKYYVSEGGREIVAQDGYKHGEFCLDVISAYFNKEGYAIEVIYFSLNDKEIQRFKIPPRKCRIM